MFAPGTPARERDRSPTNRHRDLPTVHELGGRHDPVRSALVTNALPDEAPPDRDPFYMSMDQIAPPELLPTIDRITARYNEHRRAGRLIRQFDIPADMNRFDPDVQRAYSYFLGYHVYPYHNWGQNHRHRTAPPLTPMRQPNVDDPDTYQTVDDDGEVLEPPGELLDEENEERIRRFGGFPERDDADALWPRIDPMLLAFPDDGRNEDEERAGLIRGTDDYERRRLQRRDLERHIFGNENYYYRPFFQDDDFNID